MARDLLIGLIVVVGAALALWSYTYFASRRPRGFGRAAAHVILAYFVFHTAKPAVRLVPFPPAVIVDARGVKLVIVGAGYTVTVACCVIALPTGGVTVSV